MDKEALAPAVLQLLRALGKGPEETHAVRLEADAITWHGMEGECVVARTWALRLPLRDVDWSHLEHQG